MFVWLITVLVGTVILVFAEGIHKATKPADYVSGIYLVFIITLGGFLLAIPVLFLFWLCYKRIRLMSINVGKKKMLLSIIGISFIVLTFLIINNISPFHTSAGSFLWPGSYAIALVVAIYIVKMNTPVTDHS